VYQQQNTVRINCISKELHKIPLITNHIQEIHHINKVWGNIIRQKWMTVLVTCLRFCLLTDKGLRNLLFLDTMLHHYVASKCKDLITQWHSITFQNRVLSYTNAKTSKLTLHKSIYFNMSKCSTRSRWEVF
jgi:hypothetical protein